MKCSLSAEELAHGSARPSMLSSIMTAATTLDVKTFAMDSHGS